MVHVKAARAPNPPKPALTDSPGGVPLYPPGVTVLYLFLYHRLLHLLMSDDPMVSASVPETSSDWESLVWGR